jgi:hypothetical protein
MRWAMRHDVSKVIGALNEANEEITDICRQIYKSEVDIDEVIVSIARESQISFSEDATAVFKLKESISSLISDLSDEAITNGHLTNYSDK